MRGKFVIGWEDGRPEWAQVHELKKIAERLDCICKALQPPVAKGFHLVKIKGDVSMPINGVQAGGSGVFQASLIPSNAVPLQSGPTFSTPDSSVTLTPDAGDPFKVTAAVAAGETAASFDLTVTGTTSAGQITHTFTIPVIAAPPPEAVDFDLTQLS